MNIPENGIYPDYDQKTYHSMNDGINKGDPAWVVSRSDLAKFLESPRAWMEADEFTGSDATEIGNLVDVLVCTPDRWDEDIIVTPDHHYVKGKKKDDPEIRREGWNKAASFCKEWEKENVPEGWEVTPRALVDRAEGCYKELLKHEVSDWGGLTLRELFDLCEKQVLAIAEYTEPTTGITIRIRVLIDLVPDQDVLPGSLCDLKTSAVVDQDSWEKSISNFGYDLQAYIYPMIYSIASGKTFDKFFHVIGRNVAPHYTAVSYMDSDFMEIGKKKFEKAVRLYCECLRDQKWPGPGEGGMMKASPKPWDKKRWLD